MAKNPTQKSNQNHQQVFAAHQTVTHYEGAIPHPDILREMDNLVPGTAAKLIKLAEDESVHRRKLEVMAMEANIEAQQRQLDFNERQYKAVFKSDLIGQIAGFLICLTSIAAAVYLGISQHEGLAVAIAAIPTAALIKAFFIKQK